MPSIRHLVVRDDSAANNSHGNGSSGLNTKLLIVTTVLTLTAVLLISGLLILRLVKRSRSRRNAFSSQHDESLEKKNRSSNYHRLTIASIITTTTAPSGYSHEKNPLFQSGPTTPTSQLPEIRITFPDEVDGAGRPQSGRVVIVRMGDNNAMGLEPLEDALPPYEQDSGHRFESLDLDRMGGLKEKEYA